MNDQYFIILRYRNTGYIQAVSWWKPSSSCKIRPRDTDKLRCLVKAGALIAAEIDRLQRLETPHE